MLTEFLLLFYVLTLIRVVIKVIKDVLKLKKACCVPAQCCGMRIPFKGLNNTFYK